MILQAIWFVSPAGAANMAPVFAKKIPLFNFLNKPVDAGKSFRGKRILGDNKTFRGFFAGFILGTATAYIQLYLYNEVTWVRDDLALFDYSAVNPLLWGLVSSQGALIGDAIESFFKRQTNHAPGTNWFPFDQVDFILGTLLFTSFIVQLELQEYVVVFLVMFLLHPTINIIGYLLKLKDKPF